jgi:hypothetical protein
LLVLINSPRIFSELYEGAVSKDLTPLVNAASKNLRLLFLFGKVSLVTP